MSNKTKNQLGIVGAITLWAAIILAGYYGFKSIKPLPPPPAMTLERCRELRGQLSELQEVNCDYLEGQDYYRQRDEEFEAQKAEDEARHKDESAQAQESTVMVGLLPTTANRDANLRSGPGMEYPVVEGVKRGQVLSVVGQDTAKDWLLLDSNLWIATWLVDNAPGGLPVAIWDAAPDVTYPTSTPESLASAPEYDPSEFYTLEDQQSDYGAAMAEKAEAESYRESQNCNGGCSTFPACGSGYPIKGNVAFDDGERIYHVVGQESYEATKIDPVYGERWFCTEDEAISAGWRKAQR